MLGTLRRGPDLPAAIESQGFGTRGAATRASPRATAGRVKAQDYFIRVRGALWRPDRRLLLSAQSAIRLPRAARRALR
jgi:hypothetical protein